MKRQRYQLWAEYPDGFTVLVCDRDVTFTKKLAARASESLAVRELYSDARVFIAPVQEDA